jgi:hypothetical protein
VCRECGTTFVGEGNQRLARRGAKRARGDEFPISCLDCGRHEQGFNLRIQRASNLECRQTTIGGEITGDEFVPYPRSAIGTYGDG